MRMFYGFFIQHRLYNYVFKVVTKNSNNFKIENNENVQYFT